MGSCGGSFCTAGNDDPCKALFLALEQRMNRSRGPRSTTDDFAVALVGYWQLLAVTQVTEGVGQVLDL